MRVRIDDVFYGSPGSNGQANGNGAVDSIEGVGWIDGHAIPLACSIQATVYFPDIGGYGARLRQLMLAQSFAQWLPRRPATSRLDARPTGADPRLRPNWTRSQRAGRRCRAWLRLRDAQGGAPLSLRPAGAVGTRRPADRAVFEGPAPDIVIASGRVTVPYVRAWKRRAPNLFAAFLQDPRWARAEMDLIWVPEHDALGGANVVSTLTSPHPFSPSRLAAARAASDPRLAALPFPRCAILLGGPSGAQHFTAADVTRMGDAIAAIRAQGFAVMATPSRRTPPR